MKTFVNDDTKRIFRLWLCGKFFVFFPVFVISFLGGKSYGEMITTMFDAKRFAYIACNGYADNLANLAFFPLVPFLIKLVSPYGVTVLNILLSLFSTYLVYILAKLRKKEYAASIACMYALSPIQIYSIIPYTEMLFVTFTLLAIILYEQKKWAPLMGIFAGFAVCARSTGMIFIFTVAILETVEFVKSKNIKKYLKNCYWVVPAFFLSIVHLIVCYKVVGNPFYFMNALKEYWVQNNTNFVLFFPESLKWMIKETFVENETIWINLFRLFLTCFDFVSMLLYAVYCVTCIVKSVKDRKPSFSTVYSVLMFLLLSSFYKLCFTPLVSRPRYISGDTELYSGLFNKDPRKLKKVEERIFIVVLVVMSFFFYTELYFY